MKQMKTRMKALPPRRKQAGISMLEALGFLAVGAIVLVVGVASYYKMSNSGELQTDTHNLTLLVAATRDIRDVSGYGPAGTNVVPTVIARGGVPSNMTVVGNQIYNVWNGPVTIVSTGLGFTVSSAGVPQDACISQAQKLSLQGNLTTTVNGTGNNAPVTAANATAQCSSSSSNTVAMTFAS